MKKNRSRHSNQNHNMDANRANANEPKMWSYFAPKTTSNFATRRGQFWTIFSSDFGPPFPVKLDHFFRWNWSLFACPARNAKRYVFQQMRTGGAHFRTTFWNTISGKMSASFPVKWVNLFLQNEWPFRDHFGSQFGGLKNIVFVKAALLTVWSSNGNMKAA